MVNETLEENIAKMDHVSHFLKKNLMGPENGIEEVLDDNKNPQHYYSTGILFPHSSDKQIEDDESCSAEQDSAEIIEHVQSLASKLYPSCMGVQVHLPLQEEHDLKISVNYGLYSREPDRTWLRKDYNQTLILSDVEKDSYKDIGLVDIESGYVRIVRKNYSSYEYVKVFIVNECKSDGLEKTCIFQPKILLEVSDVSFLPCHYVSNINASLEDSMLASRFRNYKTYANAFGCAAEQEVSDGHCHQVWTTFFPTYDISQLTYETPGHNLVLDAHFLSYGLETNANEVVNNLKKFASSYEDWIPEVLEKNDDLNRNDEIVKTAVSSYELILKRIRKGIDLIDKDPQVRRAFIEANRSMLIQSANAQGKVLFNKHSNLNDSYQPLEKFYNWRPFQLAFLLISLEPLIDNNSEYRNDFVDLIWFPTGGGKTEAYFGVTAFSLLYNRLKDSKKKMGTCVISRYTLKLLTSQQFERAAALVCALEIVRTNNLKRFGEQKFTIGLWVGDVTATHIAGDGNTNFGSDRYANQRLETLLGEQEPRMNNPFPITQCPCCKTPLVPEKQEENEGKYGYSISTDQTKLVVKCLRDDCIFSRDGIPVLMVDEQIYNEKPTIIIGTIDKFARLAWKREAGELFNGSYGRFDPPFLIIQDELHLISGPLGSIAGVYETAIEALCSSKGVKPYMISSTATVRRANEQCKALYGRSAIQFPPPGLDDADSYFCKKEESLVDRRYIGLLSHVDPISAQVRSHAALLQAIMQGQHSDEDLYWTLVSYFNSKRELGQATTAASDDIPARLKIIEPITKNRRILNEGLFTDLYSEKSTELRGILDRLNKKANEPNSLSLLLTSNIMSVGVDISRLSLMLINGQPKTTSEYIQASSRVGRKPESPGLVVTNYSATKSRDRSHFENFISYHSKLYASVEPTSVTPYSKPTRDRALHAIMIILARHLPKGYAKNGEAKKVPANKDLCKEIKNIILERVRACNSQEIENVEREIDTKFEEWSDWANYQLHYEECNNPEIKSVMYRNERSSNKSGWKTMDSMRNVDTESTIEIMTRKSGSFHD